MVLVAALVVVVPLVALGLSYRRQIVSYLTHWKGGPSETWEWVAHEPPPEVHIAAVGDGGDSGTRIDATGAAVAAVGEREPFDALLLLGDNVYPAGDPARLPDTVFGPFGATLDAGAELLAILGNHDVMDGHGDDQLAELGMPGRWWSWERDGVLLVGIDTNDLDQPGQLGFLDEALAASDATWKIVAAHHPPYSAGYQGSSVDVREALAPILEEHGVQLVLSGHDHDYQRSVPIDGVTYVVSGGGAGTRRTGEEDFTAAAYSWHHFVEIAVAGDQLVLRAIGQDGSVFDEVVLTAE